jgi:uncharacterized membrane protein SirB2
MQPEAETDLTGKLKRIPAELLLLVEKKLELWAIQASSAAGEKAADLISQLAGVLIFLTGVVFLLFGSAFWLNTVLQSPWMGFAVQGIFFVVLGLIFLQWKRAAWRKALKRNISQALLNSTGFGEKPVNKTVPERSSTPA